MPPTPVNKPATYVELGLIHIDDGRFVRRTEDALRKAFAELMAYEKKTGDLKGKASVSIDLTVSRFSEEHFNVEDAVRVKVPGVKSRSQARGAKDRLLVNPEGDSLNDSDQTEIRFDRFGNPRETVDRATGEVIDGDDDVAGKVGDAAG